MPMPSPWTLAAMLPVAYLVGWTYGLAIEAIRALRRDEPSAMPAGGDPNIVRV